MQLSARRAMENEERMWRQIYRAENFKRIEKRDSNQPAYNSNPWFFIFLSGSPCTRFSNVLRP